MSDLNLDDLELHIDILCETMSKQADELKNLKVKYQELEKTHHDMRESFGTAENKVKDIISRLKKIDEGVGV